jgi:hypothetical protein
VQSEPKTIAVFLDASPSGQKRAAAALAQRCGAHLVGAHLVFADATLSMSYARGHDAISQVIVQLDASAEAAAVIVKAQFQALCTELNVPREFRRIGRKAIDALLNSGFRHRKQSNRI